MIMNAKNYLMEKFKRDGLEFEDDMPPRDVFCINTWINVMEQYAAMKLKEYTQENELAKSGVSGSVCSRCNKEKELDICSGCYWNSVYAY